MSKTEKVLVIVEGERLDPRIVSALYNLFISKQSVQIYSVCLNIYNLYHKLIQDTGFGLDFVDTFTVLKSLIQDKTHYKDILTLQQSDISSIYLFFDLDAHDTSLSPRYPECIIDMLKMFDNETDKGKLYINYPMVESYKHPISNQVEVFGISQGIEYKSIVSSICNKRLENINKVSKQMWLDSFIPHLKSIHYLLNEDFGLPKEYGEVNKYTQLTIYQNQENKHIKPHQQIMVLSSYVHFLLEYLGEDFFIQLQKAQN